MDGSAVIREAPATRAATESDVLESLRCMDADTRKRYHGTQAMERTKSKETACFVNTLLAFGGQSDVNAEFTRRASSVRLTPQSEPVRQSDTDVILEMKARIEQAVEFLGDRLPADIWHCCKSCCFANLAIGHDRNDFLSFNEILRIHKVSTHLYDRIGDATKLISTRRRGVGRSNPAFEVQSRHRREGNVGTDRERAFRELKRFMEDVLPFLRGHAESPNGRPRLRKPMCVRSMRLLLGVSTNFIYKRLSGVSRSVDGEKELLHSIIDSVGLRQRQFRRLGLRNGYPEVSELPYFKCGCSVPCFYEASLLRLEEWWDGMRKCSGELKSRQKENRYLIDVMHCPLMNRSVDICNNALSALFTVSQQKVASIRLVLQKIYEDPTLNTDEELQRAETSYTYSGAHPMNRYPVGVREKIEIYLDLILRPDPGASDGKNVCRVYSPEINTQEKLRAVLSEHLRADSLIREPISSSTLQRMVNEYLELKNCDISFSQSDHNACPSCKTMQYALLQYSYEAKVLKGKVAALESSGSDPTLEEMSRLRTLRAELQEKLVQEKAVLEDLRSHSARDAEIRGFLKKLTDHFRRVERRTARMRSCSHEWCSMSDHAIITHQDDMTKVDLPSFVINASSDITRWRYDVNAHVNAVDGECIVFSHEQGSGPKNASSVMELILLDHLIRCRGESIKVIVSDNAAVGKNWLTTIALPQYIVDQGLAEIVLVVFLENNHGKWLADMLFGQLQIRRRRTTLTGVDALLSEFESIRRSDGSVQGFVVNPLASVDFVKVLESLGYATSAPSGFSFIKRNIHFAGACASGAKNRLSGPASQLLAELLPDEPGMVRTCSYPPKPEEDGHVPFERRHFDVPAANICAYNDSTGFQIPETNALEEAPLVVQMNQPYSSSGNFVASTRNMEHVGYNGFVFRKHPGYPELRQNNTRLVKESWPPGILNNGTAGQVEEPIHDVESMKCAPENWVVRRPVSHFRGDSGEFVARYTPRNMLNAMYHLPPRCTGVPGSNSWRCTATYSETPMPLQTGHALSNDPAPPRQAASVDDGRLSSSPPRRNADSASHWAFKCLASEYSDTEKTLNVLHVLRSVYSRMPSHEGSRDPWLQNRVTLPSRNSFDRYRTGLELFRERLQGQPTAARTVRWFYNRDGDVLRRVEEERRKASRGSSESDSKIISRLFLQDSRLPGALQRFERLVAKDLERYSRELNHFKEVILKRFDEENIQRIVQYG